MRSFALLALAAFCASAVPAQAAVKKAGTSGAQFLSLGVNARAIGMGEAYGAVSDGADALYWNPAGLDRIERRAVSFMHAAYLADVYYDFAAYAQKLGKRNALGLGVQYLNARAIERTDEFGASAGSFTPDDLAVSLAFSRRFHGFSFSFEEEEEGEIEEEFVLGLTAKFIRSRIVETASTGAADLGLSWTPREKWWLALGLQNLGAPLKFKDRGDDLPLNFRLGSSYKIFNSLLAAADFNLPRDDNPFVAAGLEYAPRLEGQGRFALRAGANSRSRQGTGGFSSFSLGTGLGWRDYGFDFAWSPFGNLGNAYRASLSLKF